MSKTIMFATLLIAASVTASTDNNKCVIDGYEIYKEVSNCTNGPCVASGSTVVSSSGCPENYTNYCGTYTSSSLRDYTKSGSPSMYMQLATGRFWNCDYNSNFTATNCSFGSTYSYWIVSNQSKQSYPMSDGYLNFSAPDSPVYIGDTTWWLEADGDINNATIPSNYTFWNNTYDGVISTQYRTTVNVTCTRITTPTTIAIVTLPPRTNAPGVETQVNLTLAGDFATLTQTKITEIVNAVKTLFVSNGLTLADIKEVLLFAGSIKATVIFQSTADNSKIQAAVTSIDDANPSVAGFTVTEVSQPKQVTDNGAPAFKPNTASWVLAAALVVYMLA